MCTLVLAGDQGVQDGLRGQGRGGQASRVPHVGVTCGGEGRVDEVHPREHQRKPLLRHAGRATQEGATERQEEVMTSFNTSHQNKNKPNFRFEQEISTPK